MKLWKNKFVQVPFKQIALILLGESHKEDVYSGHPLYFLELITFINYVYLTIQNTQYRKKVVPLHCIF